VISYLPENDFEGIDSIEYKIDYQAEPTLSSTAWVYVNVSNSSGIFEVRKYAEINISPNPASKEVEIEIPSSLSGTCDLVILNLSGKKCFEMTVANIDQKLHLNLNSLGLNTGVYLIKVSDGAKIATQKLIVK